MATRGYVPDASDVVCLEFDPQTGYEQAGHRPALVISPASNNGKTGLMVRRAVRSSQIPGLESAQGKEKGRLTGGSDVARQGQDESLADAFLRALATARQLYSITGPI